MIGDDNETILTRCSAVAENPRVAVRHAGVYNCPLPSVGQDQVTSQYFVVHTKCVLSFLHFLFDLNSILIYNFKQIFKVTQF